MTDLISFDLDGTLLDTAKDFHFAINKLKSHYGLPPSEYEDIKSRVSEGALNLIRFAFESQAKEKSLELLNKELLELYDSCCLINTTPFEGIQDLLEQISSAGLKWGIVTNKPEVYSKKIVNHFFRDQKPNFLITPEISGERKPSPKGLIKACQITGSRPNASFYVGDHLIDIEAGKKANMITIAAAYGYIPKDQSPKKWNAEYIAKSPKEIKNFIPELKN